MEDEIIRGWMGLDGVGWGWMGLDNYLNPTCSSIP